MSPIEDIALAHKLSVLLYADDMQLYIVLKPQKKEETKVCLEACLADLSVWFTEHLLICNLNKTNLSCFTYIP